MPTFLTFTSRAACVTEDGDSVEVAMAGHESVIGFPGIVRKNEAAFF